MEKNKDSILSETEKALYKEINLFQKKIFRKFLIDAIISNDKDSFKDVVYIIGSQWGVLRTVKKDNDVQNEQQDEVPKKEYFSALVERLWENKEKILKGNYRGWVTDKFPHSYESKICFLLNPKKYGIIFDSHNRKSLKKLEFLDKENCSPTEWENAVKKYFIKNDFSDFSIEDYFINDCNLWLKGWK